MNRMSMNNKKVILAIITVILIGAFVLLLKPQSQMSTTRSSNPSQETASGFSALTSETLASILEKKDFFFVNVHIPYEGKIKNTDAFIPYDKTADNLDKLPQDKNTKIVLYCLSGRMSEIAANELVKRGYTNVSHLSGGMIDWKKNGYEIIEE